MEKLKDFVNNINEHRGRPKKVKIDGVGTIDVIEPSDLSPEEKKVIKDKAKNAAVKKGKDEDKNSTKGLWAVEPPYDDDAITPLDPDEMNENLDELQFKFDGEEPFFIMGEAGWGKTSIIKDMAKRDGRHIITVYLDKAVASDLGGIPVPVEGKDGVAKIVNAMPDWAAYMLENEDKKFLLFFDEMNQAAPDVMNALMPIVLENVICNIKFDNFMVGAAGNFEKENDAVNELSGPLESRFKPIIIWKTGDEASWRQAFKFLYEEWKDKMPKKLMDLYAENAQIFVNPREVEHKIIKNSYVIVQKILNGKANPDFYKKKGLNTLLSRLKNLVKKDLTRTQEAAIPVIAEETFKWMVDPENYGKEQTGRRGSGRGSIDMVDEEIKNKIKTAMKRGYLTVEGDRRKYGISRENINLFCDEEFSEHPINAEMLERLINKFEADGVKFKYEKDNDWKKAGLTDPNED